jgi:hypothetical protein
MIFRPQKKSKMRVKKSDDRRYAVNVRNLQSGRSFVLQSFKLELNATNSRRQPIVKQCNYCNDDVAANEAKD